jgi:hypothetical protein
MTGKLPQKRFFSPHCYFWRQITAKLPHGKWPSYRSHGSARLRPLTPV